MKTVHEISRLTGVSIRALQYYDRIGLLCPSSRTEAGYRLDDEAALERLQQIRLFRELEFPLREFQEIIEQPARLRHRQAAAGALEEAAAQFLLQLGDILADGGLGSIEQIGGLGEAEGAQDGGKTIELRSGHDGYLPFT